MQYHGIKADFGKEKLDFILTDLIVAMEDEDLSWPEFLHERRDFCR